ncbi:hypothetical protein [Granulicella sp. dw_53]|uniref:hypothetical protein n=1 Tax=Granulicella sp. dw_53 TaxID=2719792 RepID=UPI001BD206A4|nr:hypothetical protein [Granulicella sp. dw_53]
MAQRGVQDGSEVRRFLLPAVIGFGGILLLIPVGLPGSLIGWIALVLFGVTAALVAVASVEMNRLLQGFEIVQAVAIFCLANALILGITSLLGRAEERSFELAWLISGGIAGGSSVLLVFLLRNMDPLRFGTRYLVVPLLAIVEGYILLRPDLTLRNGFGIGLLAAGASFLLFSRRTDGVSSLSLH